MRFKRNPVNPYGRRSTDFRTRSVPYIKKAALMNEGAKVLKELFNRPYRIFKKGSSVDWHYYLAKTDDDRTLGIHIYDKPLDDYIEAMQGRFDVDIALAYGWNPRHTIADVVFEVDREMSVTEGGDAFRIFSTVIDVVDDYIRKNPDVVAIKFESEGGSRSRLYKSLIERFARSKGFEKLFERHLPDEVHFFLGHRERASYLFNAPPW